MNILGAEAISSAGKVNFQALGLPEPVNPKEAQKLWRASQAMESLFAKYMLNELDRMMPKSSANGANVYGELLKQAVADKVAESGSLGMSRKIYLAVDEIERKVEKPKTPEVPSQETSQKGGIL